MNSPSTSSEAVAAPRPSPSAPREYSFPKFSEQRLPNGVRVVVAPVTKLPLVTVLVLLEAGASSEPRGKEGIAALTAQLLLEGTGDLGGSALAERFERMGAAVEAHADWDVTVASVTVLRTHLDEALALLGEVLRAPSFPEREVLRLKEERLSDLLQQLAEPGTLADARFTEATYGEGARYARPQAGDVKSVRALTRDDVAAFHRSAYGIGGASVIFAGDIQPSDALQKASALLGNWTSAGMPATQGVIDEPQEGKLVRVVSKADAPQSEVRVGHRGLPRNIPDYFPTTVMNAVLGGLFSSRINMNLREAHGYTYGASSFFDWRRGHGPFVVSTAVKSEVTGAAVREILLEIDRMRSEPIANEELTLATSYLDGVFPIRYETTSAIASALANMVIYGLPTDYFDTYRDHVRAVTTGDVLRAAQQHLRPEALRIVVVGDPTIITNQLAEVTSATVDVTRADDGATAS